MKGIVAIVVILAVYAGALLWKGSVIEKKNATHYPSIYELHKENGVPVFTEVVAKGKFQQFLTLTGKFDGNIFKASVTPQDKSKVHVGQDGIIEIGDDKDKIVGIVSKVSAQQNLLTGLNDIEIKFPNHKGIKGHHTVDLPFNEKKNVIIVGRDSVNLREKVPFVYVVKNGVLEKNIVKIGGSNSINYQILYGVVPGDEIVASDSRNLVEGQKVKVVNELRDNL